MRLFLLSLVLLATAASAQAPRLVIHAAVLPDGTTSNGIGSGFYGPALDADTTDAYDEPVVLTPSNAPPPDTLAMERAALPTGGVVYLGETLLPLGPGTVTDARLDFDTITNEPQVSLTMAPAAAQAFARITEAHVSEPIALVLDGRVLTAPTVNGLIPNGRVMIAGSFTLAEAEAIVAAVREITQTAATRAAMLRDLRARVDLSRPDSAVMALYRATAAGDWLTLARILHPDVQRSFRDEAVEGGLILEGDSVIAFDTRMPGSPAMSRPGPIRMAVRDLLETDAPGTQWSDFSNVQAATLFLAASGGSSPYATPARVAGTVDASDGRAYVVLVPAVPTLLSGFPDISEASVFEARRVVDQWRVLMQSPTW